MGKILIVEDEVDTRDAIVKIVKSINEELAIYETGAAGEALRTAKTERIDAFFLDIHLKDYSGIKLAKQIREMDIYKFTPIIFITGDHFCELEAFRNIHCHSFIMKPFTEDVVVQVFQEVITHGIIEEQPDPKIFLKEKQFNYVIKQEDIIYVEAMNNNLLIKTHYEELDIKKCSLTKFSKQLTNQFIRCHKSFIVNCSQITRIDKVNNILYIRKKNTTIPIGRKYKDIIFKSLNDLFETS